MYLGRDERLQRRFESCRDYEQHFVAEGGRI